MAAETHNRQAFDVQRSRVLDSFADLEHAIVAACVRHKTTCPLNASLGQKLKELRAAHPSAEKLLSKDGEELLNLRNAIVHSKLQILENDKAVYVNVQTQCFATPAYALTIEQHKRLAGRAKQLANEMSKLNPPSQPQPLPDAAAGP